MSNELLRYEFPQTEKIRTFLRLSYLFKQIEWFAAQDHYHDHQAAILKYFEIQNVTSRGDQKTDILQELERNRVYIASLCNSPEVDQESLQSTLEAIQNCRAALTSVNVRISHLSNLNEFLKSISQRSGMPAASCEFDIPAYHHWLHLPTEERKQYLNQWIEPLRPYRNGIDLILKLLRGSSDHMDLVARQGGYTNDLQGKSFTLLQIFVDPSYKVIPKVSANRYKLSIRFVPVSFDNNYQTPISANTDIPFKLGLCNM